MNKKKSAGVTALIICLILYSASLFVAYEFGVSHRHLSESDRQTIAIDFEKANGSWRSTLHNPCNFSPMDADKETRK